MAKTLPDFDVLASWYPGEGRTADSVKKEIGGSVNSPDIDDTCIVRVSRTLNYNGHPIPRRTEEFRTRQGNDKYWYGLRVKEFWPYMLKTYGTPLVRSTRPARDRNKFIGPQGVIGFRVPFRGGSATGHFTLWDGQKLLYTAGVPDYFAIATEAALWRAGTVHSLSMPV